MSSGDDKALWTAINWNGSICDKTQNSEKPSDSDFCKRFESLLNEPDVNDISNYYPMTQCYIPILDDPIMTDEVERCINKLNGNKAAGTDGIPPGLIKVQPDEWLILITFIFNQIFSATYPSSWPQLKIFTIFKKDKEVTHRITEESALYRQYPKSMIWC